MNNTASPKTAGGRPSRYTFQHTLHACYTGYISQAIVNNLAPLLFVIFQQQYGLTFEEVGRLILLNFGTQIIVDVISVKLVDKIGYRAATVAAHVFAAAGLIGLSLFPEIFPSAYSGLSAAVMIYAAGGGMIEVIISPIVDSLPGDEKASAMSLLHSFYCWGQMAVVLISTLFLWIAGEGLWKLLPVAWCIVPAFNTFRFARVPLMPPVPEEKLMPVRELLKSKLFLTALLLMLCAGASELAMSQWSSLFAETGLHVPKVMGDLLGPCLFAALMGLGRLLFGLKGQNLNLPNVLLLSGILCMACYFVTVFSPSPILSLLACAVCGLSVSLMWPGTLSMTAARFPAGGTAMFGVMAICGDMGASAGPWLTGVISDFAQSAPAIQTLSESTGESLTQLGLKSGLLVGILFPVLLAVGVILFKACYRRLQHD